MNAVTSFISNDRKKRSRRARAAAVERRVTQQPSLPPRLGIRYRKLRVRLAEMQRDRCAVCTRPIRAIAYSDELDRACVVKCDRSLPVSYDNAVVVCGACGGDQGNHPTLLAFYEHLQNPPPKIEKPKIVYQNTIELVTKLMREIDPEMTERLLSRNRRYEIPKGFQYAPPERAESIARALLRRESTRSLPKSKKSKGYALMAKRRLKFSGAQNHRCCYCGYRMKTHLDENHQGHPRMFTWEHVEARQDGGQDTADNLVVACFICNSLRAEKEMSAMEFYEWAINNLAEIDRRARSVIEKRVQSNKRTTLACVY
jgi:5-methylcytosine-specific restriction endonuclease McrA